MEARGQRAEGGSRKRREGKPILSDNSGLQQYPDYASVPRSHINNLLSSISHLLFFCLLPPASCHLPYFISSCRLPFLLFHQLHHFCMGGLADLVDVEQHVVSGRIEVGIGGDAKIEGCVFGDSFIVGVIVERDSFDR